MAASDVAAKTMLTSWVLPLGVLGLLYVILQKYGSVIKDKFFVSFWSRAMVQYHRDLRDMKKSHFSSMDFVKSADQELRNKGLVRVLEIGAGSGANFEFFPANCRLTVVEPNAYFEPLFFSNQAKYPAVKMDRFVLGTAENMKDIEDNSVDIAVSTLVLCSVADLGQALQEVKRVLAPGGKFYYWEHVHDTPGTWLHTFQRFLSVTVWEALFGCRLDRNIDNAVSAAGFSKVEQTRFIVPLEGRLWSLVKVHVMGVATK